MIDTASPAGSYRAALSPAATCAVCRQSVCAHPDLEFALVNMALDQARAAGFTTMVPPAMVRPRAMVCSTCVGSLLKRWCSLRASFFLHVFLSSFFSLSY